MFALLVVIKNMIFKNVDEFALKNVTLVFKGP